MMDLKFRISDWWIFSHFLDIKCGKQDVYVGFFFPVSHLKRANVILRFEGSLKYFGCHSQFKAAPLIVRLTHNVR